MPGQDPQSTQTEEMGNQGLEGVQALRSDPRGHREQATITTGSGQ